MEKNKKLEEMLKDAVIDDRPRDFYGNIIPPHHGKFLNDGGLQLPTRAFTEEEIAAARAATAGAED
jgi:hypothetical protein